MIKEILTAIGIKQFEKAVALPEDYRLQHLNSLQKFEDEPREPIGSVVTHTLESLVAYIVLHNRDGSAVFASRKGSRIDAVLDWHGETENGWARHRAAYQLEFTPEWIAWNKISGQPQSQAKFVEFIEENLPDITAPTSADVLEAIRTVSGKRNTTFESAINLANGDTKLVWKEETDAGGGQRGDAALPSELTLTLPVYRGAEKATAFEVKAFLRYRITEGRLSFELKLHRPEDAVDMAFDEITSALRSDLKETNVPIYLGEVTKLPADALPA